VSWCASAVQTSEPVYTIQPVVKPVEQPVEQQPAASCKQTSYRLSNRLFSWFDNRMCRANVVSRSLVVRAGRPQTTRLHIRRRKTNRSRRSAKKPPGPPHGTSQRHVLARCLWSLRQPEGKGLARIPARGSGPEKSGPIGLECGAARRLRLSRPRPGLAWLHFTLRPVCTVCNWTRRTVGARPMSVFCMPTYMASHRPQMSSSAIIFTGLPPAEL